MEFYKYLAIIVYTVAGLIGLIVLGFTWFFQRIKYHNLKLEEEHIGLQKERALLEREIAQKKLEAIQDEANNRVSILSQTSEITGKISDSISEKLIDNPSWLDRFMDQTGITYSASVYGKRIGHFFYEKRAIAEDAVDRVEEYLKKDDSTRFCLVIDSGTTLYPVFEEITKRLRRETVGELWRERVCIVTNNIPGVQYLMKNAKDTDNDDYSEIAIKSFILPGKPLSVYAAITGNESEKWLSKLDRFLESKDVTDGWKLDPDSNTRTKVLGFVTGNYIARRVDDHQTFYYPVARGEGHVAIKRTTVDVSSEVFILAPLMKFSFASVDLLNRVNDFDILGTDWERAKQHPKRVKYEEVVIPHEKKCVFFTTKRPTNATFSKFSHNLFVELVTHYGASNVTMPEFDLRYWNASIEDNRHLEIAREIPHENLREKYEKGVNIWDPEWVLENEGKFK